MLANLDLEWGGEHICREWFISDHENWDHGMNFDILLRQRFSSTLHLFADLQDIEDLLIPLLCRYEDYVTVVDCWFKYESTRFLYVPFRPVLAY